MASGDAQQEGRRALDVRFDVTVVDGEAGRRLAVLQAEAIIDVLSWLRETTATGVDANVVAEQGPSNPAEAGSAIQP